MSKRAQACPTNKSGQEMSRFEVSYDAICSLCRLLEKEVELFRMFSKLIKKVSKSADSLLQISDVFQAMDASSQGKLSKKR